MPFLGQKKTNSISPRKRRYVSAAGTKPINKLWSFTLKPVTKKQNKTKHSSAVLSPGHRMQSPHYTLRLLVHIWNEILDAPPFISMEDVYIPIFKTISEISN